MGLNSQSTQAELEAKIRQLVDMGFAESLAKNALSRFNNNHEQALNYLLTNLTNNEDNDPDIAKAGNS